MADTTSSNWRQHADNEQLRANAAHRGDRLAVARLDDQQVGLMGRIRAQQAAKKAPATEKPGWMKR